MQGNKEERLLFCEALMWLNVWKDSKAQVGNLCLHFGGSFLKRTRRHDQGFPKQGIATTFNNSTHMWRKQARRKRKTTWLAAHKSPCNNTPGTDCLRPYWICHAECSQPFQFKTGCKTPWCHVRIRNLPISQAARAKKKLGTSSHPYFTFSWETNRFPSWSSSNALDHHPTSPL